MKTARGKQFSLGKRIETSVMGVVSAGEYTIALPAGIYFLKAADERDIGTNKFCCLNEV